MDERPIEEVRRAVVDADGDSERVFEYIRLMGHRDATWEDYLNALEYRVLVGSPVAVKLHGILNIAVPRSGVIQERKEWIKVLDKKNIDLNARVKDSLV